MWKKAVLGAGIWSLVAIGCSARALDGSGAPADAGPSMAGESTPPVDAGPSPATALAGIWSGNVTISHPGFAGPPIDRMTIQIGDDGRLGFSGFDEFGYEASFGTPPDAIPLAGSALAHVILGNGYMLRFTVQTADWQSDHFQFTYTAFSAGLNQGETPGTPATDLTITLTGTLVDGKLRVHWTETGTQYTAALAAIADGDLTLDGSGAPADAGAGMTGESTKPTDAGTSPATALPGIWSGNVTISHPGFAGPPIDRMTIQIGDDGRLGFSGFDEFGYEASFGTPPDAIPLAGSALAHVLLGDGYMLRFTVQTADWQSDHFQFTYTAFSSGLNQGETPGTPATDLTIALTGTLVDGKLRVHWTETGTQYVAPLAAVADGDLAR